ncbi:hypothetical protein DINM_004796 [Dirofilaria immitis]|nr:hypothetical protein [Dirofilaria immitis]
MDSANKEYQEVVDAIHYSCMLVQDEIIEELEKKGQKVEFDKEVIAQVAFAICNTLCGVWPNELLQFANSRLSETLLEAYCFQLEKDSLEKIQTKRILKQQGVLKKPSTSRDRLLPSSETLKSATMEKKCLPDSMSLQRKKAKSNDETVVADTFYPDSSKSDEKEELEFLDNNISLHVIRAREIYESRNHNSLLEVKMDEKNPTVSVMKLDNEMLIESSTAVIASRETTPYIQANKSKTEFQIENLPDGDSIFCPEISILNSARRIHRLFSTNKGQFMNTSSRSSFCTADDCFSSFKFESDSEDSDQNRSLLEIDDNKNALSSTITSNRCFADKCASMNNNQEKDLNVSSEDSDVDLDATVFDF